MKKLLLVSILMLFVLGVTSVVFADENTTATDENTVTNSVYGKTVTDNVYGHTVAENVYGVKEGYIISITDSQLIMGKGKKLSLTLTIDSATKFYRTAGKNKAATIADFKAGQKILARYTSDKKAVAIRVLPGKTPAEIKARIKAKAAELAKLKAQQKKVKAQLDAAKKNLKKAQKKVKEQKVKEQKEKSKAEVSATEEVKESVTEETETTKVEKQTVNEKKQDAKTEKKHNKK